MKKTLLILAFFTHQLVFSQTSILLDEEAQTFNNLNQISQNSKRVSFEILDEYKFKFVRELIKLENSFIVSVMEDTRTSQAPFKVLQYSKEGAFLKEILPGKSEFLSLIHVNDKNYFGIQENDQLSFFNEEGEPINTIESPRMSTIYHNGFIFGFNTSFKQNTWIYQLVKTRISTGETEQIRSFKYEVDPKIPAGASPHLSVNKGELFIATNMDKYIYRIDEKSSLEKAYQLETKAKSLSAVMYIHQWVLARSLKDHIPTYHFINTFNNNHYSFATKETYGLNLTISQAGNEENVLLRNQAIEIKSNNIWSLGFVEAPSPENASSVTVYLIELK